MNRFLPCLSVRISHRRCEQRHTNLRNAGWFLGCVFCFHCLIIHIFFWKCHHQFIQWEKELIYILFTMFNESPPSSPLLLPGNYLFKPQHTFPLTEQSLGCASLLGTAQKHVTRLYLSFLLPHQLLLESQGGKVSPAPEWRIQWPPESRDLITLGIKFSDLLFILSFLESNIFRCS